MPDNNEPTGVLTGDQGVVNSPQNPTSPAPVNPAQAPSSFQQQQQQNIPTSDVSGLIANYEKRLSSLMSEKDRALNERDKAITQLADLQRRYTEEKTVTNQSLNNTATAAQSAIDQARTYEVRIAQLEGELLRASTLLERPHLAPYQQFIPTTTSAEQMKSLVDQLETVRNQDIERSRSAYPPPMQNANVPQVPGLPSQQTQQNQQQQNALMNLYANRPNMTPGLIQPGSNPAMMNPAGSGNPTDSIQQMLNEALKSGDPGKYEAALQSAATLANSSIAQQFGR